MKRAQVKWSVGDRGVSLVEGLIASSIVATVVAGGAGLSSYLAHQSRRSLRINAAIGLQGLLLNELLNREQYQPTKDTARNAQLANIKNGLPTASFDNFKILDANGQPIARVNRRTYHQIGDIHDSSGECQGPTAECQVFVDLDMDCTKIAQRGCAVAYRVGLEDEPGEVTPSALGAPGRPSSQAGLINKRLNLIDDDYSTLLGNELFSLKSINDMGASCNLAAEEIVITGVDRVTGTVQCLKKPVTPCPDQTIAHGIQARNGRLEFACHPLQTASCPPDYVFQKIDLAQLDRGSADQPPVPATPTRGTCVYRWKNHVKWQRTFPAASGASTFTASKQVCNGSVYKAVESQPCRAEIVDSTPGCCAGSGGGGSCASTPQSKVTARSFVEGGSVSCVVTIVDQCGSKVTARAAYPEGFCDVIPAQFVPPVGGTL